MFSCSLWHKQNALIWFLSTAPFSVREHTLLCAQNDWTPDCNSGRRYKRPRSLNCPYAGLLCLLFSAPFPNLDYDVDDDVGDDGGGGLIGGGGTQETRAEEMLLTWFKDMERKRSVCFLYSFFIRHNGHTDPAWLLFFYLQRSLKLEVKQGDGMWMGRIKQGGDGRGGCVTAGVLFPVDQNHAKWC